MAEQFPLRIGGKPVKRVAVFFNDQVSKDLDGIHFLDLPVGVQADVDMIADTARFHDDECGALVGDDSLDIGYHDLFFYAQSLAGPWRPFFSKAPTKVKFFQTCQV